MKLIKLVSIPSLVAAAFNNECPPDSLGPDYHLERDVDMVLDFWKSILRAK